ncbi:hypothetical protein [Aeromonas rivipollensis]|uniref:hypothetical protein n=1 Tax=Aeromonas rivipollensis TaxID=948519 RepID=UPI0030D29D17
MLEIPASALIPVGVVSASVIAGTFSFINLVLSKDQKISEFRQSWIDSFRNDLADFCGNLITMVDIQEKRSRAKTRGQEPEFSDKDLKDLLTSTASAYTRVLLRLNPSDASPHQKNLKEALLAANECAKTANWDELRSKISEIRNVAQQLLKYEWERVKKGEPTFIWSKRIALGLPIAAIFFGFYFFNKPLISNIRIQTQEVEQSDLQKASSE